MAQSLIPPLQPMDLKGNQAAKWRYFKASCLNYTAATEVAGKDAAIQVGTPLSIMGKECYLVYEHLPLSDAQRKDPDEILKCFGEHFEPRTNTIYERYLFNSCKEEQGEMISTYLAKLHRHAATCDYDTIRQDAERQDCNWCLQQSDPSKTPQRVQP